MIMVLNLKKISNHYLFGFDVNIFMMLTMSPRRETTIFWSGAIDTPVSWSISSKYTVQLNYWWEKLCTLMQVEWSGLEWSGVD